jgi:hypothetical protein
VGGEGCGWAKCGSCEVRGSPHCGLKLTKLATPTKPRASTTTMGAAYDFAPERPDHIQQILDGLDRYNPETTGVFQDYVMQQCESQTYDCYANLALLKLYVSRLAIPSLPCLYDEERNYNVSY